MRITKTLLEGCLIIEPEIFNDSRGYFFEAFNQKKFKNLTGVDFDIVQDNESYSKKGVLRGLHYQINEFAQAKIVRVLEGKVIDVALDLRPDSPTFMQHITTELSAENRKQIFIPRGFAHGFVVLSEMAIFSYKCDNYYNKSAERGILYNDPVLNIDWQIPVDQIIISDKDLALPTTDNLKF
jgi:dTDP-4-dehydrorhamnose 3,5-epimerase